MKRHRYSETRSNMSSGDVRAASLPPRAARGRVHAPLVLVALVVAVLATMAPPGANAAGICTEITKCRRSGGAECDRTKEACPPCIYALEDKYTCWDKDKVTNTCPFTGVKYDCSSTNASSSATAATNSSVTADKNRTTTTTTAPGSKPSSQIVLFAAIGGGVLVVLLVAVFIVRRRRQQRGRNMPQFVLRDSPKLGKNPPAAMPTPFTGPDTGTAAAVKAPYSHYGAGRKRSEPALMDLGVYADQPADSLDGMLSETHPPPMLGDPRPKHRTAQRLSQGFKRINSGGRSVGASSATKPPAPPAPSHHHHHPEYADQVTHDVSSRITNGVNVFDEYLKMKQEMKFDDGMSDYASDIDRFSLASTSTIGGGAHDRTLSITDSEYAAELIRNRGESECFSEMSYNDEKYSFSEDEPEAVVRKLDREVEI